MGQTILIETCHCGHTVSGSPNGWTTCPAGHRIQLSPGTGT
ncbi:hypothetical protein [Embleya hyalina]|uniref:Uncharacterized protein n=1 Tax=Embleya hyalina TaxID=516124 RepID=A0A401Z412_9ACTN|nr:hypothetical protein [Embleya hyalina]GCE01576.1 hypothetical protein EHYA_09342 [Embleya hyalina]